MKKYSGMLSLIKDEQKQLEAIAMLSSIEDEQRRLGAAAGIRCEHLPLDQTEYITNKDGRKVCDECCDHSENAGAEVYRWNGLTYCWLCCPHRFTGKDFVEDLDGVPTCIMCWVIVPNRNVRKHERNSYESVYSRCVKETSNEDVDDEIDIDTVSIKVLKMLAKEYGVRGYSKYTSKTRGKLERRVYGAMNDDETEDMMKSRLKIIISEVRHGKRMTPELKLTDEIGRLGKVKYD